MFQTPNSELFFYDKVDLRFANQQEDLLIIDKTVVSLFPRLFQEWKYVYVVHAGESLKEWNAAVHHINALTAIWGFQAHRKSRVVVCGGGSVGDFGGFYASILKRGVELVNVPTTWLSAIDSAHGGKNGLNVQGVKNQIGTFYPASQVHIFKEFLLQQPYERVVDGFGEYFKMYLLQNANVSATFQLKDTSLAELLWMNLRDVIERKYKIVNEDPYEKKGIRLLLNLGHTFGHILETITKKSHGLCVLQGLDFSIHWSFQKGLVRSEDVQSYRQILETLNIPIWREQKDFEYISVTDIQNLFLQDKKMNNQGNMQFIFVRSGNKAFVENVTLEAFLQEVKRQGWAQ